MGTFTEMSSFKRLLVWIDGNGGYGYGCIELNTKAEKKTFVKELKESLPEPVAEVDFTPDAGKSGYEDANLIVPGRIYETIRNFEEKYPEKPVLVITGLERTVPRDDEQAKKLAAAINMNRDNFYRYPSVVLFIFPNWFMDVLFREAFDFISAMGFHENLAGETDAACGGEGEMYSFSDEQVSDVPVRTLYESYADRMKDMHFPEEERLGAAAKMVEIIGHNYLRSNKDKARIKEAEGMLALPAEGGSANSPGAAFSRAKLLYTVGLYYRNQGDPASLEKALAYFQEAMTVSLPFVGGRHPFIGNLYNALGIVYYRQKRYEEALACYEKALGISEDSDERAMRNCAVARNNLGLIYLRLGDKKKALEYTEKALAAVENLLGTDHSSTAMVRSNVGAVLSSMGDDAKALEYFAKALSAFQKQIGEENPGTANIYYMIACSKERLGEFDEAYRNCRKAFAIMEKTLGPEHPDTEIVQKKLTHLEREMKNE